MRQFVAVAMAAATLAGFALPSTAQERRQPRRTGEPIVTLYELPNFEGRSMSFYADTSNLADQGFNDRARSARIEGSWRLCGDKNYRGRCEPFAADVRDFGPYGFTNQISSLQQVGGRVGRPGFQGPEILPAPAAGPDGVEGRSAVFFRRPSLNGSDIVADGPDAADAFCRQVGLSGAAYFYERERGREATDRAGQVRRNVPVLRDVLCRR
jgi:hypothetical protein